MTKAFTAALLIFSLSGTAFTQSTLLGPEGEFSTFLGRLKYDPSDGCSKPTRPYSDDQYAQDAFIRDAERYMECLSDSAQKDAKYATAVIAEGYQEAADDYLDEIRRRY